MNKKRSTEVTIAGVLLKNPVIIASGTFGYGEEYADLIDLNALGAIITKGITLFPKEGNPPPRIVETPSGMLNAIGLQNVGVEVFIKEKLPFLRKFNTPVIVNIAGEDVEEYGELAKRLDKVGVSGVEVNISCPNVRKGGIFFGQDPLLTYEIITEVRCHTSLPIIAKLSPMVSDITQIAKYAVMGGADAISLINTIPGMVIDIESRKPKLSNITGGLSGPAIKPIALRMVWEVARAISIPIIGGGGISTWQDAVEFIIAGASAITIGTAIFVNPHAPIEIINGINRYNDNE